MAASASAPALARALAPLAMLLLLAGPGPICAEEEEPFKDVVKTCEEKLHTTKENVEEKFHGKDLSDIPKEAQCFMGCYLRGVGLLTDEGCMPEEEPQKMKPGKDDYPRLREKCNGKVVAENDDCDKAIALLKCIAEPE